MSKNLDVSKYVEQAKGELDVIGIGEIQKLYNKTLTAQDISLIYILTTNIYKRGISLSTFPHPKGLWVCWENNNEDMYVNLFLNRIKVDSSCETDVFIKQLRGEKGSYFDGPLECGVKYEYTFTLEFETETNTVKKILLGNQDRFKEELLHEVSGVWPYIPTELEALIEKRDVVITEGAIVDAEIRLAKSKKELDRLNNPPKQTKKPQKSDDDYSSLNEELRGIEKETQLQYEETRRKFAKGKIDEDDFIPTMEKIEIMGHQRIHRANQKWKNMN